MIKLKNSIKVINFDAGSQNRRVVEMFPNILRCGIFGPSGSGKSNILLTILVHIRPFQYIYLCSKTAYQEKYKFLQELIERHNYGKKKVKIKFSHLSPDNLTEPEQIEENSIIIFDDVLGEDQNKIANFFLRGRHRNISCFYLSQTYTKIPKKTGIRENFNYLYDFIQARSSELTSNLHRVRV